MAGASVAVVVDPYVDPDLPSFEQRAVVSALDWEPGLPRVRERWMVEQL